MTKKTQIRLLKLITHIGALIPLALIIYDYQTNQLGAEPTREIILRTGKSTIVLLMLSLACTPVNIVFGWKQVIPLRKMLGLYAFLYVCLHFLSFTWLDYLFDLELIFDAIVDQRYVLVGFAAFLLLIPLAITSNKFSMRRLGKNWKRLHKLVYLIGVLAVIHFLWLVKNVYTEPILYGLLLALLLAVRTDYVKRTVRGWRKRIKRRGNGRSSQSSPPLSTTQNQ